MKKPVCFPAALALAGILLCNLAQAQNNAKPAGTPASGDTTFDTADSTDVVALQEAVIGAVRAPKDAPFATTHISRKELSDFSRSGRELPFLFARTPGVTAWSENGTGIGTSYLRIRGAGGSRINVTLDGVPLNSPEDQCVFWANMNSYSQLLGSVQIQRGIGSSTNGDGAFGGSIALGTANPSLIPTATVSGAYGAFNSYTAGVKLSSGLLWNHLIIEGAFHQSGTDGFMHGTKGSSGSYYASLTYLGKSVKFSYKLLGNYENTGQAWNGVTAGNDDLSLMDGCYCDENWAYDQSTGIRTYADLCRVGLGQFNSLYERLDTDGNGLFYKDENGNYVTKRYELTDGSLWPRTTDNFWQNHHILSGAWTPSEALKLSATLHYTGGWGWYEEFRYNNKLLKYGIPWTPDGQGGTIKKADFVRRKGLTQDHFGGLVNLLWKKGAWELTAGISAQYFMGYHYAFLSYCSKQEVIRQQFDAEGRRSYYNSNADKLDGSFFLKAIWHVSSSWSLFADLQYRDVRFRTTGGNDKFIDNGDGTSTQQQLSVNEYHHFFNPKAGVNFSSGNHRAYASLAYSSREPERNNYTDNGSYPFPRPERLYDTEAGYQYKGDNWDAGVGLYYMYFKDQMVQTGEVSDIGEALTTNIPRSYRTGAELTAGWDATSWLRIEGNAALSANRLLDFDEVVEDWDQGSRRIHYSDKALAFSPTAILNGIIDIHYKGLNLTWHTSYVSRQFLDNSENLERSLPGYSLSNFFLGYTMKFPRIVRELRFGVDVSNVFNARVAQSGWVYSAIAESLGHSDANRYYQIGFIPVAPCGALASVRVTF